MSKEKICAGLFFLPVIISVKISAAVKIKAIPLHQTPGQKINAFLEYEIRKLTRIRQKGEPELKLILFCYTDNLP